jgi:hypothetical protein
VHSCATANSKNSTQGTELHASDHPPKCPHRETHIFDASSLTPEQVENDNNFFYNDSATNTSAHPTLSHQWQPSKPTAPSSNAQPCPRPTTRFTLPIPPASDVYIFKQLPGGGRIITCPDDVFLESMTPTMAVFKLRQKSRREGRGGCRRPRLYA